MKEGKVTFTVSDEDLTRLKNIAFAHGIGSLNNLLGSIVKEYILRHEGCGICEHGTHPDPASIGILLEN